MNTDKAILALGADIKNKFLISDGKVLRFGPDIGDLSEARNYDLFQKEINKSIKMNRPSIIACDLHPSYFSTKYANNYSTQYEIRNTQYVQHHHAHIASVMEEHDLTKPVIGVSFDGTGFGTDGNTWGGEFLVVDKKGFERPAHLKYYMMPGGDRVVKEPWRMLLSILGRKAMPFIKGVKREDRETVLAMMKRRINSPLTSSAGRLFDAAAALLGVCPHASREAEGPVKLESICDVKVKESYGFSLLKENKACIIDLKPAFLSMIKDLKSAKRKAVIATKFHNTMADVIVRTVKKISDKTRIKDIALSGGVFQNKFLREKVISKLESLKLNVYVNRKVPVNDLNISLGQYYVSCRAGKN